MVVISGPDLVVIETGSGSGILYWAPGGKIGRITGILG